VYDAATRLREKKLVLLHTGSGRVNKYSQRISETLNLGRRELAVLCTLLLRGSQTLGEIKDRSERMFDFADLAETESVLEKLAEWPGGALAKKLPRQAGQKEARYAHLLSGEPAAEAATGEAHLPGPTTKVAQLEAELHSLRSEFEDLKRRFEALEQQFR
jgi:uncharacterized protein YceH (UPF0502 family)